MYDVAVVGAGPAGCAAALRILQLCPQAQVVLIEPAVFPRDKTCGDGIAPQVFDVFDALGVHGLAAGYPPVSVLAVRAPGGEQVARRMARPARVIPRLVFDARLVHAARARGARWIEHRVRHLDVHADRVVLDGEIAARVVIGADGATGVIRRRLGLDRNRNGTLAVALRGYTTADLHPQTMLIAVSRQHCPAYAWSFPIGDGRANVGFGVFTRQLAGGKAKLLDRLAAELPGQLPDPATVSAHQLPLSTGRPALPDGRLLLVGDAAGLVNAVTGEGIYYAALSGALAGQAALAGAAAGARYRTALHTALTRHHRHTAALAWCARSARFVDATVTTARRRRQVFDAVVDLGLGHGTVNPATLAAVGAGYLTGLLEELAGRIPRPGWSMSDRSIIPAE